MPTPAQSIVISKNGMMFGPFKDSTEAEAWASRKWPDEQQANGDVEGWDVTPLWPPTSIASLEP